MSLLPQTTNQLTPPELLQETQWYQERERKRKTKEKVQAVIERIQGTPGDTVANCTLWLESLVPLDWDGKTVTYFIYHPETHAVKIGFSSNLELRLEHLEAQLTQGIYYLEKQLPQLPLDLQLLATIPSIRESKMSCEIETALHILLGGKQIQGEWFRLDNELKAIIRYWHQRNLNTQAFRKARKGRVGFRI